MNIPCEIDKINTLSKGGMKIILAISKDDAKEALKNIYNFIDMPLSVEINVNAGEQQERLKQINEQQRKKIYVLFNDIAYYMGEDKEYVKEMTKGLFNRGKFSLSDCQKELASDFIEYLICYCIVNEIPLTYHPSKLLEESAEKYLAVCITKKVCCVCGQPGQKQYWEGTKKISLCSLHSTEAERIGKKDFEQKYYVAGVVYNS